ncbi:M-phase phosphoprotein 8-like [Saccostrea cucullata]|uniref:M-phase phosphoprotein 8-like n=1 Tax=Saccostrea cuccullata TaxID=36930 RepID=UPI002ED2EBD0
MAEMEGSTSHGEGASADMAMASPSISESSEAASSGKSEDELFEVERIVGMSKNRGKTLYKVRWKNYGPADDTWEPVDNLQSCLDLVEDYQAKKEEDRKKRAEERKKKMAQMEGRKLSTEDEDSSRDSTDVIKPVSTFKNTFWKDLEEGRVNLFYTDMYSKVKGGGRASRPTCLKDKHQNIRSEDSKSQKKKKKLAAKKELKTKERDKKKQNSLPFLSREFVTSSEDEVVNSDYEIVKSDTLSTSEEKLKQENSDSSIESSVRMPVLKIKKLKSNEDRSDSNSENEDGKERRNIVKKVKKEKHQKSDSDKKIRVKKTKTEVKVKPGLDQFDNSVDKSESKVDSIKTDSTEKPPSPIKSYLSGGSTPPRKLSSGDLPSKTPQATSTPDVKSEKESQDLPSAGVKRKHGGSESDSISQCKVSKVRRDSGQTSRDSGLASSTSSVSSVESDRNKSTRRKDSANSMDCSQPLDDLWSGSLLPLLPESTKTQERGADLSFDIELDDIDLDQLDKETDSEVDAIVITDGKFQQAVTEGDYQAVRSALNSSKKYDVEARDDLGITLLMYAAQSGFDDIAELLVSNGADINAQQKNGTTSLMLACEHAHICTVALLVELGAKINVQQDTGETALMKAVKRGHKQIVKFLLEYGANFSAQNNSGFTALTYAKMLRLTEIEDIITESITRLTKEFDKQVAITLNNTAKISSSLFPMQVFPLCESSKFVINFKHEMQPNTPGVGYLLFIAHARITATDCKCRFYGPCAVNSATLNGVPQPPLTEEANFVLSCCPLQNGRNEIVINTVKASTSKAKLVICAYKAQLIDG